MAYIYEYPRPCVTTDIALFRNINGINELLLIERRDPPFQGMWALPGGFLEEEETLEQCAARELEEETTIKGLTLNQFRAYSTPKRDPRHRTITIAFWGFVSENISAEGQDDAARAQWFPIHQLPPLAFDHQQIIDDLLRSESIIAQIGR